MCGDFIEYRVSISSVVMIFNYIQDEATNSRCAELIVVCVYCGGGGVVMERFYWRDKHEYLAIIQQDNSINAFDQLSGKSS